MDSSKNRRTRFPTTWLTGLLVIAIAGCSEPTPATDVVQNLNLTLANGDPLPERLAGDAQTGVTLQMDFVPGKLPSPFHEREVLPPDEWRIIGTLEDEVGETVAIFGAAPEFYSYDRLGSFYKGAPHDPTDVLWISPKAPEERQSERQYRWARIPLPEEAGAYHLAIVAYPTATPDNPGIPLELGEGVVIFESEVDVSESESPQDAGFQYSLMGDTEEARDYRRAALEAVLLKND